MWHYLSGNLLESPYTVVRRFDWSFFIVFCERKCIIHIQIFLVRRNWATLKNVVALVLGVFIGFSIALLFVISLPSEFWTGELKSGLRNGHYGYDSADATGVVLDVG